MSRLEFIPNTTVYTQPAMRWRSESDPDWVVVPVYVIGDSLWVRSERTEGTSPWNFSIFLEMFTPINE